MNNLSNKRKSKLPVFIIKERFANNKTKPIISNVFMHDVYSKEYSLTCSPQNRLAIKIGLKRLGMLHNSKAEGGKIELLNKKSKEKEEKTSLRKKRTQQKIKLLFKRCDGIKSFSKHEDKEEFIKNTYPYLFKRFKQLVR